MVKPVSAAMREIISAILFSSSTTVLTRLVLGFFLNVRFFLLFIVLAPALAIHWTLKSDKVLK